MVLVRVAEVEVDMLTGEVQVLGIWAAHDVGRAINPRGVEGRDRGRRGAGSGSGSDGGLSARKRPHCKTHGFAKYILPTALDIPQINTSIVEDRDRPQPIGCQRHRRAVAHPPDRPRDHERDL